MGKYGVETRLLHGNFKKEPQVKKVNVSKKKQPLYADSHDINPPGIFKKIAEIYSNWTLNLKGRIFFKSQGLFLYLEA